MPVSNRIHEIRTKRGLSQEELALRSDITPTYLGLIERNQKNPTIRVIEQLCNSLNISLSDFFASDVIYEPEDELTFQLLSQVANCSQAEKQLILQIIKNIMKFCNISEQDTI